MTDGYHPSDVLIETIPKAELILFNPNHHFVLMKECAERTWAQSCGES